MPTTQKTINFPVRKGTAATRPRSKRNVDFVTDSLQKPNRSKRTSKYGNEENVACSPPKRSRRNNKENDVNSTLVKTAISVSSPAKKIPPLGHKIINSPIKENVSGVLTRSLQNTVNILASPIKSPRYILTNSTPVKVFDFSPSSHRHETPRVESAPDARQILSKARFLDFSCEKDEDSHPAYKLSQDHDDFKSECPSNTVSKAPSTPLRQKPRLLQTPTRQSPRLKSPLRSNLKNSSPVKSAGVKNLSSAFDTKPATKPESTKKHSTEELRRSPRKHLPNLDSEVLQSPRKVALQQPDVRRSPRKHNTPLRLAKQDAVCYQKAKRALNTALPDRLLCREKQYKEVNGFLDKCLQKKEAGSLYISGAPGTGKTAVLSHTLKRLQEELKRQVIYINCMSVKNSQAIFNRVLGDLTGKESNYSCKEACKRLEKSLTSKGDMVCMIMDEVDQLDSKNQEVLYTVFEWPHLNNSRLVLIGIANALDLTDRVLPRLQAKPKCKPKLMNFPPYTKDQIVTIITDRLAKVEVEGQAVLDAAAIQMCARKVAAVAGDMRKALDVCRRAIEMVEAEVKRQGILAKVGSPSKAAAVGSAVPKRISVAHIMRCVNEVYGARTTAAQSGEEQTIPLQQKLAVCTLLLTLKQGKNKEVPLGKLHENYSRVCRRQEVPCVDQGEFLSVCGLVEARGIMGLKKAKDTRLTKVWLKLDEGELEWTLRDKTLVSSVLQAGL